MEIKWTSNKKLNDVITILSEMEEGGLKEFEYSSTEDSDFDIERFKELYPDKYFKYMKEINTKKFKI